MKEKFYRNAPYIYMVTIIVIELAAMGYLHSLMEAKNFDSLISAIMPANVIFVIFGTIAVGIWGENKIEKMRGE